MKFYLASTALGLVLAAGVSAAQAQTVITREIVNPGVETVQTTETVRTVRPAPSRSARRQVVTTRRTVTRQVVPTSTVVARTVPAAPQPLYDVVSPAPAATSPDDYGPPLYDTAAPAVAATPIAQDGLAAQPFIYRYVYEPDRILVIDPNNGVAVQSIPR
ncbi:MAG: hypothetical protein ABSE22_15140 [Xanthobacteraceae bacterium]